MKISDIKNIKPNSLFYRTFFSLMTVFAVMSILVFLFISYFMHNNLRSNMQSEYERTVETSISSVETELHTVYRSMEQLANKEEIVNAAIRPGIHEQKNNSRTIKILSLLSSTSRYNDAVDKIYLYELKTDELYTSSDQVSRLRDHENSDTLKKVISEAGEEAFVRTREGNACLKQVDDELYLCMNFLYAIDKPLSRLMILMDKQYLFDNLLSNSVGNVCIMEKNGNVIAQSTDVSTEDFHIEHLQQTKESGVWDGKYYIVRSPKLGWIYAMEFDSDFVKLSRWQIVMTILPMILIFLIISVIISIKVSMSISAPIGNIVDFLKNADHESSERFQKSKNELEFLKEEYQHSIEKENYIQNVLKDISSEVVERVLIGLMEGKEQDKEEVKRIIENTGTSFAMDGRYSMIIMEESEGKDLSGESFQPYTEKLKELVREYAENEKFGWYRVFYEGRLIDLFGFDQNAVPKDILMMLGSLKKRCIALSENWPFKVQFGRSYTYVGISSLKMAYSDAVNSIPKQQEAEAVEEKKTEVLLINSFAGKLKHLEKTIAQGNMDEAKEILNGIFADISHYEEQKNVLEAYQKVLQFLAQQEADNRIRLDDASLHEACAACLDAGNAAGAAEPMKTYGTAVLEELDSVFVRRKNKYIVRAKEYILEHYQDSGLNLSQLADELDINKSYLSTIFNDTLGIGFVEYLNSIRIAKAKELLETSSDSAGDICTAVGFNSSQNFIRVFRKYVGVTPGQYRKEH